MTDIDWICLSDDKKKLYLVNLTKEYCREYQGVATNSVSVVNSSCATLDVQYKHWVVTIFSILDYGLA